MMAQSSKIKHREYMRAYYHRPYVKLAVKNRIRKDIRTCKMCDKLFSVDKSERGKYCSQKCYWEILKLNPPKHLNKTKFKISGRLFKGTPQEYSHIHYWIGTKLGKPSQCEDCGRFAKGKQIDWANKSGEYKQELNDWIRLCKKCHWSYDKQFLRMQGDEF